jgi:hypothetical protein
VLESGGQHIVPVTSLTRLEVSLSRKRHTLKGAIIGAAIGVGLGFAFKVDPQECNSAGSSTFCSRGEAVAGGTLVGVGIGALVGALVRTDRWTPIDLETLKHASPLAARSSRLVPSAALTIRF